MSLTRRRFLQSSALVGAGVSASPLLKANAIPARPPNQVVHAPKGDWMANTPASAYRAYRSKRAQTADATTWVQIDLGEIRPIDFVKVYPANEKGYPGRDQHYAGEGFPVRFRIECSSEPDFRRPTVIVDHSQADFPNPEGYIQKYEAHGAGGRYVRLTATRLMKVAGTVSGGYYLALGKIDVYSAGKEIAALCPVMADSTYGVDEDVAQITRPARLGGETVHVDHPENVTDASTWQPPQPKVQVPRTGVQLQGGVFQKSMEDNIEYLLNSFSVDDLLRQFRERTGAAAPPLKPMSDVQFWEEDLAGSNAGRFLMAAGNTLRWIDHGELRRRLNAVVDGIAQCRQPNGYIMAYPEDTIFFSERGAYTRAWLVHGLIEAGYSGNQKAFDLLRGYSDWFNQSRYLPNLLRFAVQGGQGMIANTRMYFTPVGKPADIQVIQRYFQENYWMDQLAAREERAVWQYPYDRPHCYLLTNLEAYMDLYRATGDPRYRRAIEGGWELYHDKWENPGGSISIIEFVVSPPRSYSVDAKLEELCGNSFWVFLSQRLHLLEPDNERYAAEIERSIYNVALANQAGSNGFRYHALLAHHKEQPTRMNTCCEGQGTRLIGSLPEHIYSIAEDGLYVNLFEPSAIEWVQNGEALRLESTTRFPFDPAVRLSITAARPVRATIRVRTPAWAAQNMPVHINGEWAATGRCGSYITLEREWHDGDAITFTLPMALRAEPYAGVDQIPGYARFSVSYGPVLLAAVGSGEVRLRAAAGTPDFVNRFHPLAGQPLHFSVENNPGIEFMPYWQIDQQAFTCFPGIALQGA